MHKYLKMNVYKVLFCGLTCLIFSKFSDASSFEDQICYTPFQKYGKCVVIQNCPELHNMLYLKPLPKENVNYLRQSQCGFEGTSPKVCCSDPVPDFSPPSLPSILFPDKTDTSLLPDTDTCGLHIFNIHQGRAHALTKEFPWLAILDYEKPDGHEFDCGGTLINNRYVLTAAHCVDSIPEDWKLVSVRLGENNLDSAIDCDPFSIYCANAPIDVPVEDIIVHEHYHPHDVLQLNDIALIRLRRNVTFNDFVRPICLPTSPHILDQINIGTRMHTAGWGIINEERSHSHAKLKDIVQLRSHEECSYVYSTIGITMADQLCIEEQGCAVDSGGPLVISELTHARNNWFVIGIKSFGPTPCGNNNWPGVYTKVTQYLSWIVSHLEP